MAAMYEDALPGIGGTITEEPKVVKPPTRKEREDAWRKENEAEYKVAQKACCTCTPTRAQMLLVDQYDGHSTVPID